MMTTNVLQDRTANPREVQSRNVFHEFTDMVTVFRLLVVADRIEGAELARVLKRV
jgi:hypothetical protein